MHSTIFHFRSYAVRSSLSKNYQLENIYDNNSQRRTFGSLFSSKTEPSYNIIRSDTPPIDKNSYKWFKIFKKKRKKRVYNRHNKQRRCGAYKPRHVMRKSDNYGTNQYVATKYYSPYNYGNDYFPPTEMHNEAPYSLRSPAVYYNQQNPRYVTDFRPHIMRIPWKLTQTTRYPHVPVRKVKRKIVHSMKPWNYPATWRVAPSGKTPSTYHLKEHVPGIISDIPPYSPQVNNKLYQRTPLVPQHQFADPISSASNTFNNYMNFKENNFNENTWQPSSPLPQPETNNNTTEVKVVTTPSSVQRVLASTEVKYEAVTPVSLWVAINQTNNLNQIRKKNISSNAKEKRVRKNVKKMNQESKSIYLNRDSSKPDIVTAVYPLVNDKNEHESVQNLMQKSKFVVFSNKNNEKRVTNFQIVKRDPIRNENKN